MIRINGILGVPLLILIAAWVLVGGCLGSVPRFDASWLPPKNLVGRWEGYARIYVNWTKRRRLSVSMAIAADGTVTGSVEDAKLVSARIHSDRDATERALNLACDFIVIGKLEGPVIAAEGIRRDGVFIPFNLVNGRLVGGVDTTRSWFGGKDSMDLAAGHMVLKPVGGPANGPTTTEPASQPTTER